MILWTLQHKAAYDVMLKTGALRANEQYLFCQDDLRFAYNWIASEMQKRISAPPAGVRYPVWAWYQLSGQRKRPDMRTYRDWAEKGTPIVLMTVEVPDEMVLLSDFDMWHIVLANEYLALREEDDKEQYTEAEKIHSWETIFCYDAEATDYWPDEKTTQATIWEIRSEWVKKAEHFVSR